MDSGLADLIAEAMLPPVEVPTPLPRNPNPNPNFDPSKAGRALRKANSGFKCALSAKWMAIMTLQMRGHTYDAVAQAIGSSVATVGAICRSEKYQLALRERLDKQDDNLFALKPLAVDALRRGLVDPDGNIALRASDQFFRLTGTSTQTDAGPKSAVEVARALISVHIHQGDGNALVCVGQAPPTSGRTDLLEGGGGCPTPGSRGPSPGLYVPTGGDEESRRTGDVLSPIDKCQNGPSE